MYKDVEGFEGLYQVSDNGEVLALSRTIINKNGREQYFPQKQLTPDIGPKGYARVTLCKNHTTHRFLVHRLVGKAFVDNPLNHPFINHKDNNPSNNLASNLEWATHSENMIHAQKQGRLLEAQSKGGKTAGISGVRANEEIERILGTQINNWLILSFAEYRKNKKYFNVRCTCGAEYTREQYYLTNNLQHGCIKCKTRP